MPFNKKYNWDQIRREFIYGIKDDDGEVWFPSIQDLHERHGVSTNYLYRKKNENGWGEERERINKELEKKEYEKQIELIDNAQKFNEEMLEIITYAVQHVKSHLKNNPTEEPKEIKDLKRLSTTLETYQKIGRLSLGQHTDFQKQSNTNKNKQRKEIVQELKANPEVVKQLKETYRQLKGNPVFEDAGDGGDEVANTLNVDRT